MNGRNLLSSTMFEHVLFIGVFPFSSSLFPTLRFSPIERGRTEGPQLVFSFRPTTPHISRISWSLWAYGETFVTRSSCHNLNFRRTLYGGEHIQSVLREDDVVVLIGVLFFWYRTPYDRHRIWTRSKHQMSSPKRPRFLHQRQLSYHIKTSMKVLKKKFRSLTTSR